MLVSFDLSNLFISEKVISFTNRISTLTGNFMDLKQLEAFVAIATLRSFRRAANRLHLSQPAVSLRLQSLENELGTRLFDRQGANIRLTGPGLQLLRIAEEILDGAQKLKATASGTLNRYQTVRLGVTSTIANAWLSDLIDQALTSLNYLVVDVIVNTTPNLRAKLISGEIDVTVQMGPVHETGIRNVPLKTYRTEWIAGQELRLPERQVSIHEVAAYPIITYAKDSATYSSLEEALRQSGMWPTVVVTCASVETILNLVENNRYVGIICEACLKNARVRRLDCDMQLPDYEYVLSYHLDSIDRVGMTIADIAKSVC